MLRVLPKYINSMNDKSNQTDYCIRDFCKYVQRPESSYGMKC